MPLPFIDRDPTPGEVQKLRLLLSTFQDGTGMLADKNNSKLTLPGWRDFERATALALSGYAQESKAIFDVIFPDSNNPRISYGISCKMRNTLDRIDKDGRVTLELSNSAGMFWNELHQSGITQENYRTRPQEVGPAVIKLYEKWHREPRTDSEGKFILQKGKHTNTSMKNLGTINLEKSCFLVLSYNKKGIYQLHQFPLVLPDPTLINWEFTSKKEEEADTSKRLVARDDNGILFEWYAESGGQLKYYPLAKDATWYSDRFQLEPLDNDSDYGILSKAQVYFPEQWKAACQGN